MERKREKIDAVSPLAGHKEKRALRLMMGVNDLAAVENERRAKQPKKGEVAIRAGSVARRSRPVPGAASAGISACYWDLFLNFIFTDFDYHRKYQQTTDHR